MYHGVHLPIALEGNYRESGQLVTVPGMPGSDLFGPRARDALTLRYRTEDHSFIRGQLDLLRHDHFAAQEVRRGIPVPRQLHLQQGD